MGAGEVVVGRRRREGRRREGERGRGREGGKEGQAACALPFCSASCLLLTIYLYSAADLWDLPSSPAACLPVPVGACLLLPYAHCTGTHSAFACLYFLS